MITINLFQAHHYPGSQSHVGNSPLFNVGTRGWRGCGSLEIMCNELALIRRVSYRTAERMLKSTGSNLHGDSNNEPPLLPDVACPLDIVIEAEQFNEKPMDEWDEWDLEQAQRTRRRPSFWVYQANVSAGLWSP